jgi:predicted phosphodiesterase
MTNRTSNYVKAVLASVAIGLSLTACATASKSGPGRTSPSAVMTSQARLEETAAATPTPAQGQAPATANPAYFTQADPNDASVIEVHLKTEKLKIAFTSDIQGSYASAEQVGMMIASKLKPDNVILAGDLSYYQDDNTLDRIAALYCPFNPMMSEGCDKPASQDRVFVALGNHDDPDEVQQFFKLPGNGRYYMLRYFSAGEDELANVFILDGNFYEPDGCTSGSAQADWFSQHLAASEGRYKIAVVHEPLGMAQGEMHPDDGNWLADWVTGVDVVISGHTHRMEEFTGVGPSGDEYLAIVGAGGAAYPAYSCPAEPSAGSVFCQDQEDGAALLAISAKSGTLEFYDSDGQAVPGSRLKITK